MNDLHGVFDSSEFEARMKYDHRLLPEILTECFKTVRSTTYRNIHKKPSCSNFDPDKPRQI